MLILSQSRMSIINTDHIDVIQIWSSDPNTGAGYGEHRLCAFFANNESNIRLGGYPTMDEAIAVLEEIARTTGFYIMPTKTKGESEE